MATLIQISTPPPAQASTVDLIARFPGNVTADTTHGSAFPVPAWLRPRAAFAVVALCRSACPLSILDRRGP